MQLFESQHVRTAWNETNEEWYFSIIDVIAILTGQTNDLTARKYWNKLKQRLKEEGSETVTNCHQLKMPAKDNKMRLTDVASTEHIFRIIQSVPSSKAEPFKLWMAEVAKERIDQVENPELSIEQAMRDYRRLGYSEEWINARLQSMQFRKELTDQWKKAGVKEGLEYAILTNLMTKEWSGKTVSEYKKFKGLKKENLRDNMTNMELALSILAEASASEISKAKTPEGLEESKNVALDGAKIAKQARKTIEKRTGKSAISSRNAQELPGRTVNKELPAK